MKIDKGFILSFVAPSMIIISIFGFIQRQDKKIFYLPLGIMGIAIILEKELGRQLKRQKILRKIKSYQKVK